MHVWNKLGAPWNVNIPTPSSARVTTRRPHRPHPTCQTTVWSKRPSRWCWRWRRRVETFVAILCRCCALDVCSLPRPPSTCTVSRPLNAGRAASIHTTATAVNWYPSVSVLRKAVTGIYFEGVYTSTQVFIDTLAAQRPNNLIKQEKV